MHPLDQIGIGGFQHHMKVVAHQTIGVHPPIGLWTGFRQRFEEILPVHLIMVYIYKLAWE